MAYTKTNSNVFTGLITGVSIGGTQVGWTGNRVAISMSTQTSKMYGGQSHASIGTNYRSFDYQITFSLREFTLANLAVALGQATSAVTNTGSSLTVTGAAPSNVAIKFEAYNEQKAKYLTFFLPVCQFSGSGEVAFNSDEQGDIPITFDIIDSSGIFTAVEAAATTW